MVAHLSLMAFLEIFRVRRDIYQKTIQFTHANPAMSFEAFSGRKLLKVLNGKNKMQMQLIFKFEEGAVE